MNKDNTLTCEILITSDLHGHLGPIDYRTGEKRQKGLATIASLIKQERSHCPELILLDNGDLIQGTPLAYYAATQYSDELNPGIAALNELKYDAAIIGNHEFNFGKPLLNKAIQDSKFPWLSAGIIDRATCKPAFGRPYIIKWIDKKNQSSHSRSYHTLHSPLGESCPYRRTSIQGFVRDCKALVCHY